MATAAEDLICSICGNSCTDRVSLPCLHRFCKLCILQEWDPQKSSGVYVCPQCGMQLEEHPPLLHKKRRLYVEETVPCTYCDDDAPAEKTCLHCEDSLCAKHLAKHSTGSNHVLIEPTASLKDRKCTKHEWQALDHYCIDHKVFICLFCYVAGNHKGHEVISLKIYSAGKGKEYLIPLIRNLRRESEDIKTQIHSLEAQEEAQARKPDDFRKRVTDQIQNIKKDLEGLQEKVLNEVDTQKRKVAESVLDCKKKLEEQRQELCRKISEIQKLHDIRDPLTFLNQAMETDLIGIFNVEPIKVSGDQLCETPISEMLHKELLQFTDGLNKKFRVDAFPKTQELRNISDPLTFLKMGTDRFDEKTPISKKKHKELLQFADRLINLLLKDAFPKMKKSKITLDMKTAHCKIIIRKQPISTAYYTANRQVRRSGPLRFRSQHVLSKRKFSSGNHYWEVEVKQINCSIGVAYNNIERKTTRNDSRIGHNKKSWGLSVDDKLIAWHNSTKIKIPSDSPVRSFGIFLEYEAGRLSFYQLCDPIRHLHTFTTTFTRPLNAAFYLGEGSKITILK
ncbi:E3 ubiquitin/ISG15 ligase TRIM25-like isoform X2 [Rana temporaria]|nr:E3 ubiquitin/ISG15 ligase TRIM25-like isoform X2 [Rana temporaria]